MNGLLVVDKPEGPTSFDIVRQVRRRVQQVTGERRYKVGHTGTLDPFASGVLPVAVGDATRLCEYLIEGDKGYRVTLRLGVRTDTDDRTGEPIAEADPSLVTEEAVRATLEGLVGTFDQVPPAYSALHVDGRRAYDLARKGREVELDARPVTVHRVEIRRVTLPEVDFDVWTSKGTYVRALCRDVGESLGVHGHCQALRRLASAGFTLDEAHSLEAIVSADRDTLASMLLPSQRMLAAVPCIEVDGEGRRALCFGQRLVIDHAHAAGEVVWCRAEGELVCVAVVEADGRLKPHKVMAAP